MVYFVEDVNKTTIYSAPECRVPGIGEHIVNIGNLREYAVVCIISVTGSKDVTVVIQPVSSSQVQYNDCLRM